MRKLRGRVLTALAFALLAMPGAAHAASVTVTTTKDGDDGSCTPSVCTLRDAVKYSAADTIVLPASSDHYHVVASEIPIERPLTIQGAGVAKSVIDATAPGQHRAFHLFGFPGADTTTVAFRRVTITGAHTSDIPGGAGIDVAEAGPNLRLVRSVVSGNQVDISLLGSTSYLGGGGIHNESTSNTTLVGTRVTGNTVTFGFSGGSCCSGGGGIYIEDGELDVSAGSHVDGNSVTVNGPATAADAGGGQGGGGIYQQSAAGLTIANSSVSGNTATVTEARCCHGGGGIFVNTGTGTRTLTLTRAHVDRNKTTITTTDTDSDDSHYGGGGIFTGDGVKMVGGSLNGNVAKVTGGACCHGGGAIDAYLGGATLSFTRVDMSRNRTNVDSGGCCSGGGAIQFNGGNASLLVRGSLLSFNRATIGSGPTLSGGGAIYEDGGEVARYTNTTISGNRTNAAGSQQGGGGLYALINQPAAEQLANVTLAGNAAPKGAGGGILSASSEVQARNSIVGLNVASTGRNCAGFTASGGSPPKFTSGGFNLENGKTCHFTATGDRTPSGSIGVAPLLDNGGPTATRGILTSSPAFNGGNPAGCRDFAGALLTTDQRGFARPFGPRCDIGAFELHPPHLRALKVKPSKFTVPPGTTVSYLDDQPSNTTVTVLRCKRQAGKRVCKQKVGEFVRYDSIGANKFHLAKVSGHKLAPGRYLLRLRPRLYGLAGKRVAAPFRVVG